LRTKALYHIGLFLFFIIISFSSCLYDSELTYLTDQIISLNRRVAKLENAIEKKLGSDLDSRLKTIHTTQAEMTVEIERLKGKVGDLSGRTEDSERIIRRTVERDLGEQDAVQSGLVNLSQKVTEIETMVRRQHEYLGLEPVVIKGEPEQEKREAEKTQTGEGQKVAVKEPKSKEVELYDSALASFKKEEFEAAMEGFKNFIKKYPRSDRADNAQFWIGESHMALQQYEQAILAFQTVIKRYPRGNKVPNALLRQAMAFLEIKDKISSKLLLKRIVKQYPKSSEAKIARKKLKTIR